RDHPEIDSPRYLKLCGDHDAALQREHDGLGPEPGEHEAHRGADQRTYEHDHALRLRTQIGSDDIDCDMAVATQDPCGPKEGDVDHHRPADLVDAQNAMVEQCSEHHLQHGCQHHNHQQNRGDRGKEIKYEIKRAFEFAHKG